MSGRYREEEEEAKKIEKQSRMQRLLAAAGTGGVLLYSKGKFVLGALKFTKFLPALSMLASTGAYALFFGWPYAAGMVGLIAVHEAGHMGVMRALGIPSGPMTFIPFMGAYVEMKDRPQDAKEEALVALGGPVLGGAAAIGVGLAGASMDSQLLISLADFGIMINLFNLMPIGQLDGGRILGAVSKYFLLGGLAGGGALIYNGMIGNPLFYLVMLMGGFSTYERFFNSQHEHSGYHKIPNWQKAGISLSYLLLVLGLVAAMDNNKKNKKSLAQIRAERPELDSGSEFVGKLEKIASDWSDEDEEAKLLMERQAEDEFFRQHFAQPSPNDNFFGERDH
eukprot:CAMPEP_0203747070 /NCGR_PEP_ID=MMETSP0098-20131031/2323_1 /ASSEMBLY_ACC=CAM_ASM_000208 /TAXON_ID=96639 /ORGANISM=" , Strain NY0313808BC1" /LENGTH=336 /DNA_ID=CAMNT_0050635379 /DNA_START=691 /DNA_END=1701 /DNA_ORIENTATION=+